MEIMKWESNLTNEDNDSIQPYMFQTDADYSEQLDATGNIILMQSIHKTWKLLLKT